MKKILISSGIIAAVAVVVVGATIAYYNDTETSAGNIFVAGELDLKVDHKFASYNGNPCIKECVENPSVNLIQNGSFENPEVTNSAKWQIFPDGTSGMIWTVEWESTQTTYNGRTRPALGQMEYHENVATGWVAKDGDQYAELDSDWFGPQDSLNGEPALIRIYQMIPTTAGQQYKLHYHYSPRPDVRNAPDNELKVRIDGIQVQNPSQAGNGSTTVWTEYTYPFTGTGNPMKIEFAAGGTANSLGVFIDKVSVHPIECTYQIIGGTCTLWDLKDLGQRDYYWDYDDVKPGDWGINIISLHAYDNDAYACLITHNIVDAEDTVIDPEIEAGDTIESVVGELSGFIHVFAWEDTNQNNAYDVGEPVIAGPNALLKDAIGKISLTESNTKYIGLAWCAGTQGLTDSTITCDGSTMSNIAQTDIMTASITAYVEQQRNNLDFDCSKVVLP